MILSFKAFGLSEIPITIFKIINMEKTSVRLEAFCDGVFAIAITLLIIEIKIPSVENVHTKSELWTAFAHSWPSWLAFLVSFITILISWTSHAAGFKFIHKVSPKFTYANGLLLLSIIILPFFTAAVAEFLPTDLAQPPVTLYCGVSLLNNISWIVVQHTSFYPESLYKPGVDLKKIKKAASHIKKGFFLYAFTFVLSFWFPVIAFVIVALSFVAWLVIGISLKEEK